MFQHLGYRWTQPSGWCIQPHVTGPCKVPWELSPQIISRGGCGALWSQKQQETKPVAPWLLLLPAACWEGAGACLKRWSRGRNKGLAFSGGSITPLPSLLAFTVFAFSDLVKKGNTLRAVPSSKLLERTYHCPWEAVLTTSMGTLALVMTWEAACPLCPRLALEEPRVGLEGKTRVLALDKMEWPLPADACLLYPALSVYYQQLG